jgi:1,4-alpha-glucan branching enzyme
MGKMPGDDWQRFANLRLLLAYMYAQPGKKLIFMGSELGQWGEWDHDGSLDWHLLQYPPHQGLKMWIGELNRFYVGESAMHETDFEARGFEWVDCNDAQNSVVSFLRKGESSEGIVLAVFNLTPVPHHNYRVGVPRSGMWREMLNSDAKEYGGSGQGNLGSVEASPVRYHGRSNSLNLTLPPLAAVLFKHDGAGR